MSKQDRRNEKSDLFRYLGLGFKWLVVVPAIAVAVVLGLGVFGLGFAILGAVLAYYVPSYRDWLAPQRGFKARLAKLPGLDSPSRRTLTIAVLAYLVPPSILCTTLTISLISQIGHILPMLAFAVVGIVIAIGWAVLGWRLPSDVESAGGEPKHSFPLQNILGTLKEHSAASVLTALAFFSPVLFIGIGALSSEQAQPSSVTTEKPTDKPMATEELLLKTPSYTAISNLTVALTKTPTRTDTPFPTETGTPTPTKTGTAVPTDTPVPTEALTTTSVCPPEMTESFCNNVVDGDTIDVLIEGEEYRVRYIGIDTPETSGDCYSREATERNEELVLNETLCLEKDVSETDRYGRLLHYVYVGDTFVNATLVSEGYAFASTYPPDVAHADEFASLQKEARQEDRGLWSSCATATPTVYPRSPTSTPEPTVAAAPTTSSPLQLGRINYDGDVHRVESDEWVEVINESSAAMEIAGWRIRDDDGNIFTFPSYTLQAGQACRVYTDEVHPETGGFSFGSDGAVWGNSGDIVLLVNPAGEVVDSECWGDGCQ